MLNLKKLVIIDGSYFMHRSLKQKNLWELRNSNLERTGGIFGFLNILQKELKINNFGYPIVTWDDGQSDRRLKLDENYKRHKEKMEDPDYKPLHLMTDSELDEDYVYNYKLQRKKLIEILRAFGIPCLLFRHTEGDDLMYWLSKHCEKSVVLTDDRDLLQLVSETCKVRRPMANEEFDLPKLLATYEIESTYDFVRRKALCGDGSDNIPGACFRVGEKSANEFFKLYDLIKADDKFDLFSDEKNLSKYCKEHNIKFKKAYCNFDKLRFDINMGLVDLDNIRPYELSEKLIYEQIKDTYKSHDLKKVMELLKKYEMNSINVNSIFECLAMTRFNIKEVK